MNKTFLVGAAAAVSLTCLLSAGIFAAAPLTPAEMGALRGGCRDNCWWETFPYADCGTNEQCPNRKCVTHGDCAGLRGEMKQANVPTCAKNVAGLKRAPYDQGCGFIVGCKCDYSYQYPGNPPYWLCGWNSDDFVEWQEQRMQCAFLGTCLTP